MEEKELLVKALDLERRLVRWKKTLAAEDKFAKSARSLEESEESNDDASKVVYVGHVPHGFYEDEMLGFFGQFGTVKKVRLSRSKKTSGSKGYAFVEFARSDVAQVAAKAMDSYLMGGKQLVCHVVPPEFVKERPNLMRGKKRRPDRGSRTVVDSRIAKNPANLDKKMARLHKLGYHYDFPSSSTVSEKPMTAKKKMKKSKSSS